MKRYRFLPVMLTFWPYLILLLPLLSLIFPTNSKLAGGYMQIYSLATIPAVYLSNILLVCFWKNPDPAEFEKWNLRLKLAHIPFYLMGFVFGFAVMLLAPGIAVLEWILMMTTSAYGIRAALQAGKQGKLSRLEMILLIIGHCSFVADVICAWILHKKITGQSAIRTKAISRI